MAIVFAVVQAVKKANGNQKKAAPAKKPPEQQQMEFEEPRKPLAPTVAPTVGTYAPKAKPAQWRCACGRMHPMSDKFCGHCGDSRTGAAPARPGMVFTSGEGTGKSGSMSASTFEGTGRGGSMGGTSFEGVGRGGSLGGTSFEGAGRGGSMGAYSAEGSPKKGVAKPSLKHVVAPVTESRHHHEEYGMTGAEYCEDGYVEERDAYEITGIGSEAFDLDISDRDAVIRGIIWSEILQGPKARRTH